MTTNDQIGAERPFVVVLCALIYVLASVQLDSSRLLAAEKPSAGVIVGESANDLEQRSADELCRYLAKLFEIDASPSVQAPDDAKVIFIIGVPSTNATVPKALNGKKWPEVSDQGIVMMHGEIDGKSAFIVGGGSSVATLWAVYELVERWGVRYLIHGDVFPQNAGEFKLPENDIVLEPKFPIRQWRIVNDFACGPEAWGISDYRPILDQLCKLKFNRVFAVIYPWQPFLDLKYAGIERRQSWLWYDMHYPLTADMPGRRLLGSRSEWWNPDLPLDAPYRESADAGERLVQKVFEHAKRRGMQVAMSVNLAEFPKEFAFALRDYKTIYPELGELTVTPGPSQPIRDEKLMGLCAEVFKRTVNTYPDVDFVVPALPEIPHWTDSYNESWKALDAKHKIESRFPLEGLIGAARNRQGYAGGPERAVQEVKSNITLLYLIDKLVSDQKVFASTKRPDAKLIFNSMAEEILPLLPYVLPEGSETLNLLDYTPDRIAARPDGFKYGSHSPMRHSLIFTLHDDNVGILPMLNTGSLATLANHMQRNGWAGFSTRYWLISDHDPCIAFIAKRAWDDKATAESVYRDQIETVCGPNATNDLLKMYAQLEALTVDLNQRGMGITFPVGRGMIEQQLTPEPLPEHLLKWRDQYRLALEHAQSAEKKTSSDAGKQYVRYWVGRLKFGAGYFDCAAAARLLSIAAQNLKKAEETGDATLIAKQRLEMVQQAEAVVELARTTIEAFAEVARDQSDRGVIAILGKHLYRPLKAQLDGLKK